MIPRSAGLWWCALAAPFACGGSSGAKPDAARDAAHDAPVDAGSLSFSSMVDDYQTGSGIANAQVCVPTNSAVACTATDGSGNFTLVFPGSALVNNAVSATAEGYLAAVTLGENGTTVTSMGTATTVAGGTPLLMESAFAAQLLGSDAGFTVPSTTTGYLVVRALGTTAGSAIAGATATISPAATVVYADGSGNPDRALGSASQSGVIYFGGVTPGQVSVTVMYDGVPCTSDGSDNVVVGDWPPTDGASVDAYVVAGAITEGLLVNCQ